MNKCTYSILILVFFLVCVQSNAFAEDRLELDETSIQGASELPKVLYIVLWKKTTPDNKPVKMHSVVDEVMSPVDRSVLRRQIRYYDAQKK